MPTMTSAQAHDLCLRLLRSESEDEVVGVLQNLGFWDDRSLWQLYGGIANNRGIVGNQQSSPVAALVEKLVNSIDAVLIAECHRNGIDPRGPNAPQTMQAAVEQFLHVRGGQIDALDAAQRTSLAGRVQLVATGTKDVPCYIIIDEGEGQTPDQFPTTFLSLLRENKTNIPFVQGKYNMGGTGVLQFSGTQSFQLVISRRQPDLPVAEDSPRRDWWGFTLVRRLEPGADQPQSTYVYLAPEGKVPAFQAPFILARPGRYPDAYAEPLEAGTCIKLWNYKVPQRLKAAAASHLNFHLERRLQAPALPIRIHERRQIRGLHTHLNTVMAGLLALLSDHRDLIDSGLDTGSDLAISGVGTVQLRVVVVTKDASPARYAPGVYFNVNGQLHGELGSDFISRRTKLDYIADTTIVLVDCTLLPPRVREDVFLASRDRMRHCQEREGLESSIVEYLKDHPGLRELNTRRRQERLASVLSDEETAHVIQDLVRSDPTLAALFGRGSRINVPVGPIPEPAPYIGRRFPTYFRLARAPRNGLLKKCPRNRTCRIEMETDAANDYFTRSTCPGTLESRGVPQLQSRHLWNGKATLRYVLPDTCNVDDRFRVDISVIDVSRVDPFDSSFCIEVGPEAEPEPPGSQPPPPGQSVVGLPNIVEVLRDQWVQHGFDEQSAVELKYGDEGGLDLFLNMDNLHLLNEIARRRTTDPELVRYWFKYGLCLLSLGMLYQQRRAQGRREQEREERGGANGNGDGDLNGNGEREEDFAAIAEACRGMAVTIIPVIAQLGQGRVHGRSN